MSKLNAAILDFKKNFANERQGKQNFHGKSYAEVVLRSNYARQHLGSELDIVNSIKHLDDNRIIIQSDGYISGKHVATGIAEEVKNSSHINKTSHVENCETGAVGRMLANLGLAGTAVASAGEVSNAIDGSLRIALKQLEQVTSAEQYKSWLTKNQTDMKSLSSSNPDAYKDFITDFTEIKNKLVTKGVIQNGGK